MVIKISVVSVAKMLALTPLPSPSEQHYGGFSARLLVLDLIAAEFFAPLVKAGVVDVDEVIYRHGVYSSSPSSVDR